MKSLGYFLLLGLAFSGILTAQLLPIGGGGSGSKSNQSQASTTIDVIVQYDRPVTQSLLGQIPILGGILIKTLPLIDAITATIPISALEDLARQPGVKYITRDFEMTASMAYVNAASGANVAHSYGWKGNGIGIALIDSGIDQHGDLPARVVYTKDFVKPLELGADRHGHGTHIAGIIFGKGKPGQSGQDTQGIASQANLINLRVLDERGSGRESNVIDAIAKAIELKNLYNIRVINLSLGRPVFDTWTNDPLCRAVKKAWDAGIVVVVAAGNYGRLNEVGNNGYGTITSPGNTPAAITVGAMNTLSTMSWADDVMASYSSKGPAILDYVVKPDLVAPGNRVLSTIADGNLPDENPDLVQTGSQTLLQRLLQIRTDYMRLSGTSMASPVVAAAAALLLQKTPGLSPDSVKARLMKTARKNFPNITTIYDPSTGQTFVIQNDIFTVGAGYLDILAALNDNSVVTGGTAESPTVAFDGESGEFYLASGQTAIWGRHAAFGETAIWGRNIIEGSTAIWGRGGLWGNTAIWGRSETEGFTAIWGRSSFDGSTAIWGRNTADGSTAIWGRDAAEGSTAIWGRNASEQLSALSTILLRGE